MTHPNQLALPVAVTRWIEQSQSLPNELAADRLTLKINALQDGIHEFGLAAQTDRDPDDSLAGLSVIDIMAAQGRLIVERNVRLRFAAMGIAA